MGCLSRWFGKAVPGLRSFAYASKGSAPESWRRARRRLRARHRPHRRAARARRGADSHRLHRRHQRRRADRRQPTPAARRSTKWSVTASQTRFRDFGRWTLSRMGMASNERLEDYLHRFTPREFHRDEDAAGIVATDLIAGESVHFTRRRNRPRAARLVCLPRAFSARRISESIPGRWISHRDGSGARGAQNGRGSRDLRASRAGPAGIQAAQHHRSDQPVVLDHPDRTATQSWRDATDVLIEPDVHHILWDEFVKSPQLIAAGENATHVAIPKIRAVIDAFTRDDFDSSEDRDYSRER